MIKYFYQKYLRVVVSTLLANKIKLLLHCSTKLILPKKNADQRIEKIVLLRSYAATQLRSVWLPLCYALHCFNCWRCSVQSEILYLLCLYNINWALPLLLSNGRVWTQQLTLYLYVCLYSAKFRGTKLSWGRANATRVEQCGSHKYKGASMI